MRRNVKSAGKTPLAVSAQCSLLRLGARRAPLQLCGEVGFTQSSPVHPTFRDLPREMRRCLFWLPQPAFLSEPRSLNSPVWARGPARHDPVAFRGQILYGVIRENGYMTGTGIAFYEQHCTLTLQLR